MTDLQRVYAVAAATQRLVTRDHRIELPERLAAHLVVVEARRVLHSAGVEHDLAALDEETEHVIGPWRPGWWEAADESVVLAEVRGRHLRRQRAR